MSLRPASTVILLREVGDGFRVFMVQRNRRMGFMPSAWVFPGGRVDSTDALLDHPSISGGEVAAARLGLEHEEAVPWLVAAVRETFEEAGVWLGDGQPPEELRAPLARRELVLAQVLADHPVQLDLQRLHPWSRWVTPEAEPKRYDTRFFVAVVDEDRGRHDEDETVRSGWYTPEELLSGVDAGRFPMAPPTWWTLRELHRCGSLAGVRSALPERVVRPIQPILQLDGPDPRLLLPGHPEHGADALPGLPKMVRFRQGRWWAD